MDAVVAGLPHVDRCLNTAALCMKLKLVRCFAMPSVLQLSLLSLYTVYYVVCPCRPNLSVDCLSAVPVLTVSVSVFLQKLCFGYLAVH